MRIVAAPSRDGSFAGRLLTIGSTRLDDASDCYVIAEVGHNHQSSVEKCKELFRVAKECGVNAVKLQKRDNRSLHAPARSGRPTTWRAGAS